MFIITIDSGTTNTRVKVWEKDKRCIIAQSSRGIGVRDVAITGSKDKLMQAIKDALLDALELSSITSYQELFIVASGMITSNVGLFEIPHLIAPIDQQKLANGMVKKIIPEIINHPIWFIPGIRNDVPEVDITNCEMMDAMRGEEVEAFGVISLLNIRGPALIILPGSHSKFVQIDKYNQITASATTLAGELLDTITQQTILASSLNHQFVSHLENEYLLKGVNYCQQVGIARSCFSIRILDLFGHLTINQKANFLLGCVLCSDLLAIKNSRALNFQSNTQIIICGKKILREALAVLINHDDFFKGKILVFEEENYPPLAGFGAISLINKKVTL